MKAFNCSYFGDYPEEFAFCVEECPILFKCQKIQTLKYPIEAWRLVARKAPIQQWIERSGVKKK